MGKALFYEAFAEYLRNLGIDAQEVTDVREETYNGGYCETCSYEDTEVEIDYLDSDGTAHTFDYYGSFGALIRSL